MENWRRHFSRTFGLLSRSFSYLWAFVLVNLLFLCLEFLGSFGLYISAKFFRLFNKLIHIFHGVWTLVSFFVNGFFLHLRKSYNNFRSFSSEKKSQSNNFYRWYLFPLWGLNLKFTTGPHYDNRSKIERRQHRAVSAGTNAIHLFFFFFYWWYTVFLPPIFIYCLSLNSSFHGVHVEMYRKCWKCLNLAKSIKWICTQVLNSQSVCKWFSFPCI